MKKVAKNIGEIILTCVALFMIYQGGSEIYKVISNSSKETKKDNFTLVSSEMTENDAMGCIIEGTISNNTDKAYDYAQVTFNLYDSEGNQIGTAWTNINNLQAKGTWKFKAVDFTNEEVAKYELAEITGW